MQIDGQNVRALRESSAVTCFRRRKKNLEQAREQGYTVDQEEHVVGLNCIASAIYDDAGSVVAAISISGPASRLTEDRFISQGELVRDTAKDISTALGLKPPVA